MAWATSYLPPVVWQALGDLGLKEMALKQGFVTSSAREAAVVVDFSRGAGTRIDKTDDEARRSQRRRRIVCIICT